jgi:hypothetical protein
LGRLSRVAVLILPAAVLAGTISPANACRVERPLPTKLEVAAAKEPRLGFVGRIMTTFSAEETKQSGQAIVQIEVTEDFTKLLPPVIYVLNPGCCVCVRIGGKRGEAVMTIVRRGDDGLFHLDY